MIWLSALSAVIIVSLLSLLGVLFLVLKESEVRKIIPYAVAASSGVLLGSVFLDLLPESLAINPEGTPFVLVLVGFISFFIIEKLLQWHHHIEGDHSDHARPVAYLTLFGDAIHNFVDGAVLAGAFLASPAIGLTTTIAVIAHEIPHELSDFLILIHGGFANGKALFYNFLSATTAIVGTLVVLWIASERTDMQMYLVPFAAGNFLYIAATDLVPELLKKRSIRESLIQLAVLGLGIVLIPLVQGFTP